MTYAIVWSDAAQDDLGKLDKPVRERILRTLDRIQVRPHTFVKRLVGVPQYRLRVGDWRVIMDISDNELRILVIEVARRDRAY
jgi:mRNA interferase RelE/StbE